MTSPTRPALREAAVLSVAAKVPLVVGLALFSLLASTARAQEQPSTDSRTARGLTAVVTASLAEGAPYEVVTAADLRDVLSLEAQQQLAGCVDESCMAEIGAALGTRYVVFSRLDEAGDVVILSLSLMDTSEARVVRRASVTGKDEAALVESARTALGGLVTALREEGAERVLVLDVKAPPADPGMHVLALTGVVTAAGGLGLFALAYVATAALAGLTMASIRLPGSESLAVNFIPLAGPFLTPFLPAGRFGGPLWLALGTAQALTLVGAAGGGALWLLAPDEE